MLLRFIPRVLCFGLFLQLCVQAEWRDWVPSVKNSARCAATVHTFACRQGAKALVALKQHKKMVFSAIGLLALAGLGYGASRRKAHTSIACSATERGERYFCYTARVARRVDPEVTMQQTQTMMRCCSCVQEVLAAPSNEHVALFNAELPETELSLFHTPAGSPSLTPHVHEGLRESPRLVTPPDDHVLTDDGIREVVQQSQELIERVRRDIVRDSALLQAARPYNWHYLIEQYDSLAPSYASTVEYLQAKERELDHMRSIVRDQALRENCCDKFLTVSALREACQNQQHALNDAYVQIPLRRGCEVYQSLLRGEFTYINTAQDERRRMIIDMMWYLYAHAVHNGKPFVEGTFKVYDPARRMYDALLGCHERVYVRPSSHDFTGCHGLDIPCDLRGEVFLPNNKYTLLIGRDDAFQFTYIKPEDWGFDWEHEKLDFAKHAYGWGESIFRRVVSPVVNDVGNYRKERVPQDVVASWQALASAYELPVDQIAAAKKSIWRMICATPRLDTAHITPEKYRLLATFCDTVKNAAGKDDVYGRMGREVDGPYVDRLQPTDEQLAPWRQLQKCVRDNEGMGSAGSAAAYDQPNAVATGVWGYVPTRLRWW